MSEKRLRQALRDALGKPCPYCGRPMDQSRRYAPTRDHLTPRSRGGELNNGNCLIVCSRCNHTKGGRTIEEYLAHLVRKNDKRAQHVARAIANAPTPHERRKRTFEERWDERFWNPAWGWETQ